MLMRDDASPSQVTGHAASIIALCRVNGMYKGGLPGFKLNIGQRSLLECVCYICVCALARL